MNGKLVEVQGGFGGLVLWLFGGLTIVLSGMLLRMVGWGAYRFAVAMFFAGFQRYPPVGIWDLGSNLCCRSEKACDRCFFSDELVMVSVLERALSYPDNPSVCRRAEKERKVRFCYQA